MRRDWAKGALALLATALATGGCSTLPAASAGSLPVVLAAPPCATAEVTLGFDFEGASQSRCVIEGARRFSLLIGPEHAPPINPSPWYAFRYRAQPGGPVTVTLRYLEARHRYAPKLTRGGAETELAVEVDENRRSATLTLPAGEGIVSAQPIHASAHYAGLLADLARDHGATRIAIGRSLDGRPIEALRFGAESAPRLIVLVGRQHPPEVTGAYAMGPFLRELAAAFARDPALGARYQVLAVPLLNPDGVALGHWRANRGGVDLNRDWGPFTQPETRAVRDFLDALPAGIRPVVQIDFHSTARNLFYVQGKEATAAQQRFVALWLEGREGALPGYPFTIERTDATPGAATSKVWFHARYGIPTITYEVGDRSREPAVAAAAEELARNLIPALDSAAETPPGN